MKKILAFFLITLSTISVNGQSASGQTNFESNVCCFNGFTWTINYKFIYNSNNAKGIDLEISNRTISVRNNKYQIGGKLYSPSDLGMLEWPVGTEEAMLSGTVTIYYNGSPIKTYNEAVITSKSLGRFDQWKDGGKDGPYAGIGSLKIKLNDFNVNNLSVKFTNVSAGGVNPSGSEQIYKAVQAKIQEPTNNLNGNNGSLVINGTSNNSSSSSPSSTSSTSTNTQQTINPNDPNPMTNGTNGNYQAPKSSSSTSNGQLTVEEQQSIQQGVAVGTELISDGVALISDALDAKKQRRESQYFSETDKVMAIGYCFSTSSWLGLDVSVFNPGLGKLGWGVTGRFNPNVLWGDYNVGLYGDYRDHYLYDDDYSYELLETSKKISFNIGASLNIGLSNWLFIQIGGGVGSVSTYSKYEITNANSSFRKENIGDKFYSRKDEDQIMGFCNENNLVLRFTNILCLKTGFATYNFKSPEFIFGILFMPGQ